MRFADPSYREKVMDLWVLSQTVPRYGPSWGFQGSTGDARGRDACFWNGRALKSLELSTYRLLTWWGVSD